ncbi:MAG: hypothetical protein KF729_26355 [Sandaracinaceae bacterium]|nr:hypothetical protein [Sandaracinaceae bacterium]
MDGLRMLMLAGSIASAMIGGLYASVARVADTPASVAVTPVPVLEEPAEPEAAPILDGHDVPLDALALLHAEPGSIVEPETGVVLGPLTVTRLAHAAPPAPAPRVAPRPARAPAPSVPRLHADPGYHVILTARRMIAQNQVVQGSCYRYLSEVFARAGHEGWRNRRTVYGGRASGPYADLGLIRPGDWLYIVNHPDRTPVGTHSVLFVGWEDRASGYARVIEHSGWGAPSAGQERSYDVSRTYRIIRPVL